MTVAIVVLAVGATPAMAATGNALRSGSPKVAPAVAPAPVSVKPAVWIPVPAAGIKWSGGTRRSGWGR
jgi:hypothetical protein